MKCMKLRKNNITNNICAEPGHIPCIFNIEHELMNYNK